MADIVDFRPGQTLNIIWTSVQDTPLGYKEVESSFAFPYEELLARLKAKGKAGKSRRSGTDGAQFSRVVSLSTNAIRKGKWSTGADIEKAEVFAKLKKRFEDLDPSEYPNITENACNSLKKLYASDNGLPAKEQQELASMLDLIGIER